MTDFCQQAFAKVRRADDTYFFRDPRRPSLRLAVPWFPGYESNHLSQDALHGLAEIERHTLRKQRRDAVGERRQVSLARQVLLEERARDLVPSCFMQTRKMSTTVDGSIPAASVVKRGALACWSRSSDAAGRPVGSPTRSVR